MTLDEIEKAAFKGYELEGFADLSDFHLHTCLSKLYADFKDGKVNQEQAGAYKKKLVAVWESDKKTTENAEKMYREYADAIRKTSTLHPEKAKTKDECIQILAEIVAALTGDNSLPDRLRKQKWGA